LKYGWLIAPILPPKVWPKWEAKVKRAITSEEHQRILAVEQSAEWRLYFQVLWELGASQTDAANLDAGNIDWELRTLAYQRKKLSIHSKPAVVTIGRRLEALLRKLPSAEALFPHVGQFDDGVRAWHFAKRCRAAKVNGVTLHSYRYAWAERAAKAGYPERWAQVALGHNSRAVHQAYAKRAHVVVPSLESYESRTKVARVGELGGCP
jgi:integrase